MITITPTDNPVYVIAYTDDYEKIYFSKVNIGSSLHSGLNNTEQFASKVEMVSRLEDLKGVEFINSERVSSRLSRLTD